jgi:hypothetical protein
MIDDVHLDVGVRAQIGDSAGRADVGENKVLIIQDTKCPFRGRFGVPSGQTVATNPNRCRSTNSFMSSDNLGTSTSGISMFDMTACG